MGRTQYELGTAFPAGLGAMPVLPGPRLTRDQPLSDASTSDQLVASVFRDHAAGEAALAKLRKMAPQLSEAGASGVLTLGKGSDGRITAGLVDLPGPHVLPGARGLHPAAREAGHGLACQCSGLAKEDP
jgi:hypothetical protein